MGEGEGERSWAELTIMFFGREDCFGEDAMRLGEGALGEGIIPGSVIILVSYPNAKEVILRMHSTKSSCPSPEKNVCLSNGSEDKRKRRRELMAFFQWSSYEKEKEMTRLFLEFLMGQVRSSKTASFFLL